MHRSHVRGQSLTQSKVFFADFAIERLELSVHYLDVSNPILFEREALIALVTLMGPLVLVDCIRVSLEQGDSIESFVADVALEYGQLLVFVHYSNVLHHGCLMRIFLVTHVTFKWFVLLVDRTDMTLETYSSVKTFATYVAFRLRHCRTFLCHVTTFDVLQ